MRSLARSHDPISGFLYIVGPTFVLLPSCLRHTLLETVDVLQWTLHVESQPVRRESELTSPSFAAGARLNEIRQRDAHRYGGVAQILQNLNGPRQFMKVH